MNYKFLFCFALLFLSACGQTGPLYLPSSPPPTHPGPPPETPQSVPQQNS